MFEPEKPAAKMVRRDKMFFTAFACLVIGFLGGIGFSIYKMPAVAPSLATHQNGLTPEQQRVMESLEQAVADNPENVQAWTQLGHLYFDTDHYEKAINAYSRSLELHPDDADVVTDLGVMHRRNGQPEQAIASFKRAIEIDPRHETARFNMGVVLLHDFDDQTGARKVWSELIELNPVAYAPNGRLVAEMVADLEGNR
ncbi:tetratricopeptide repeat protein [Desulfurivibrio dismutans]|uniref:tetratricopeptide repeat protein n=1 Tax=Desulfurivibrio dismutans TaxID=1398908 RepID=UPI0023D9D727|nr:tetratricopeptide repeat protein [Desulfurivibrio alkaliphilus]MDF1615036.1 tetratricopeptide repeat protein [Desulfurivibrio alkaliphilus]